MTPIPRRSAFLDCFACGPDNPRGLRLVFEREADTVVCSYTAPRELASYGRILHGGVTSTLLDEAMAWAVYGLLDKLPLTTELHVRLLGSIHAGEPLSLTGRIVSADARSAQGRAELRNAAGALCAESEGRLRFVSAAAVERLSRAPHRPPDAKRAR